MTDAAPKDSRRRNTLFAVIALAIAGAAFVAITAGGIGENLVYYWGPTELHGAGDKAYGAAIRLGGQVEQGTVLFQPASSRLEFKVTDGRKSVHVKSSGVPPQMFREGIGVVVEGTMKKDGSFHSERLMVSHGNEYKSPEGGQAVDSKKLIQSTKGIDG